MNPVPRARLFRRDDRDQLTDLVNTHLSAVIPGARVSVNAVLSSLERQADEYVVDPWVIERATIVVEHRERIVAAAHLQRFADTAAVSEDYRGAGLIQWLLSLPTDAAPDPAALLLRACLAQLRAWGAVASFADGQLPYAGVYGIPASWPHVRRALAQAGFVQEGGDEAVLMATLEELPGSAGWGSGELRLHREVAAGGMRLRASRGGVDVGHLDVDLTGNSAERLTAGAPVAEVSDWEAVDPATLTALFAALRGWLLRGGATRVLAAIETTDADDRVTLERLGFREVTVNARGWVRRAP